MVAVSVSMAPIVQKMLERLTVETTGVEHVKERVKIGTAREKKVHTIRRIVHVRPKKEQVQRSEGGREIDWTHRWAVRGHWRVTAGLGKDREGNYCIEGYTWVVDHVRGPEDQPLIKKTRIVEGGSSVIPTKKPE